jgi:hypothetical protein
LHGNGRDTPQYRGNSRHLLTAEFIQLHSRHAPAEDATEKGVMSVTYEMNVRGHMRPSNVAFDKAMGPIAGFIVSELLGRRLHEIA